MKSVFVRGNGFAVTPGTQSPRVLKRCAQVTQETRVFLPCEYRSDFSRFIIFLLRVRPLSSAEAPAGYPHQNINNRQ